MLHKIFSDFAVNDDRNSHNKDKNNHINDDKEIVFGNDYNSIEIHHANIEDYKNIQAIIQEYQLSLELEKANNLKKDIDTELLLKKVHKYIGNNMSQTLSEDRKMLKKMMIKNNNIDMCIPNNSRSNTPKDLDVFKTMDNFKKVRINETKEEDRQYWELKGLHYKNYCLNKVESKSLFPKIEKNGKMSKSDTEKNDFNKTNMIKTLEIIRNNHHTDHLAHTKITLINNSPDHYLNKIEKPKIFFESNRINKTNKKFQISKKANTESQINIANPMQEYNQPGPLEILIESRHPSLPINDENTGKTTFRNSLKSDQTYGNFFNSNQIDKITHEKPNNTDNKITENGQSSAKNPNNLWIAVEKLIDESTPIETKIQEGSNCNGRAKGINIGFKKIGINESKKNQYSNGGCGGIHSNLHSKTETTLWHMPKSRKLLNILGIFLHLSKLSTNPSSECQRSSMIPIAFLSPKKPYYNKNSKSQDRQHNVKHEIDIQRKYNNIQQDDYKNPRNSLFSKTPNSNNNNNVGIEYNLNPEDIKLRHINKDIKQIEAVKKIEIEEEDIEEDEEHRLYSMFKKLKKHDVKHDNTSNNNNNTDINELYERRCYSTMKLHNHTDSNANVGENNNNNNNGIDDIEQYNMLNSIDNKYVNGKFIYGNILELYYSSIFNKNKEIFIRVLSALGINPLYQIAKLYWNHFYQFYFILIERTYHKDALIQFVIKFFFLDEDLLPIPKFLEIFKMLCMDESKVLSPKYEYISNILKKEKVVDINYSNMVDKQKFKLILKNDLIDVHCILDLIINKQ